MPEEGMRRRPQAPSSFQKHQGRDIPRQSQSTLKRCQGLTWLRSWGSPKGFPPCGVLCCSQNAAEVAERSPESSPATAALALIASKSSAIRCNSQKVGKWWMNILALPPQRLARQVSCALCPGFATSVSDLRSPLPNIAHGTHLLLPGGQLTQGSPSPGGPPYLTHQHCPNRSHSQTFIIPGLAPCPLDLGGPCSAPLGCISRHTQDDVNNIQPCFYTALLGKPADHTAELLARPARLLGQGLLLLQLPNNGCWRELSAGLQGWFSHQVPQLVSPCHLSAQPRAGGPVIHRRRLPWAPCWEWPRSHPTPPGEKGSCWVQRAMRDPMGRGSQDHQCSQKRGCNAGTLTRACATDERSSPAA